MNLPVKAKQKINARLLPLCRSSTDTKIALLHACKTDVTQQSRFLKIANMVRSWAQVHLQKATLHAELSSLTIDKELATLAGCIEP
jgi:hypothetical protein